MTQTTTPSLMQNLRKTQYPQLSSVTYLDYTASPPIPQTLPERHLQDLQSKFQANPHSETPPSTLSTNLMNLTRDKILQFFNAPKEYTLVFTANATAAAKLVGEAFPFRRGSTLLLAQDNHNSVLGLRCFAETKHARVSYIPLNQDFRMADIKICKAKHASLLAYPAQSNFSGVRHGNDLVYTGKAHGYHVLLDAAAFVPTSRLDLSKVPADYVTISFYKMFGWPTGIGALIVRKDALSILKRPTFSGGTVEWVSLNPGKHMLTDGVEAFHDGTPNFLGIPAVMSGLLYLESIGMGVITEWITRLTGLMIHGLVRMTDTQGRRVIAIYGPESIVDRGGTVAFDVVLRGRRVRADVVARELAKAGVFVRDGCFCNPGCGDAALGVATIGRCASGDISKEDLARCLGKGLGFVRVSVGLGALDCDVDRFLEVLKDICKRVELGVLENAFWEVEKRSKLQRRGIDLRWVDLRKVDLRHVWDSFRSRVK